MAGLSGVWQILRRNDFTIILPIRIQYTTLADHAIHDVGRLNAPNIRPRIPYPLSGYFPSAEEVHGFIDTYLVAFPSRAGTSRPRKKSTGSSRS